MGTRPNNLPKRERLCSHYLIDRLFDSNASRSFSAYPIRVVYQLQEEGNTQIMISVPKRQFKHAVDRNHVKRQIREAYRLNRKTLLLPEGKSTLITFIWLDNKHYPSATVDSKVTGILRRISEKAKAEATEADNKQ